MYNFAVVVTGNTGGDYTTAHKLRALEYNTLIKQLWELWEEACEKDHKITATCSGLKFKLGINSKKPQLHSQNLDLKMLLTSINWEIDCKNSIIQQKWKVKSKVDLEFYFSYLLHKHTRRVLNFQLTYFASGNVPEFQLPNQSCQDSGSRWPGTGCKQFVPQNSSACVNKLKNKIPFNN